MLFKNISVISKFMSSSIISNVKDGSAAARASNFRIRRLRRYRNRFALALIDFREVDSARKSIKISTGKN